MITVIHGNHVLETRNQLASLKTKYSEIVSIDARKAAFTDIIQALESATFSGDSRLVVLEYLFSGKSKTEDIIGYLINNNFGNDLVVWDEKKCIGKDFELLARKARIIELNLPTQLFRFLDSLMPDSKNILALYQDLLKTENEELIFFMLKRHVRSLLLSASDKSERPSDIAKLLPWQMAKLARQSSFFSEYKLIDLYKKLLNIEYSIKTGNSAMSLDHKLKIFLSVNF